MTQLTSKQQIHEFGTQARLHSKLLIVISIVVLILIELLFIGNIAYAIRWVSCEKRPVVLVQDGPLISSEPREVTIISKPGFFEEKHSVADNTRTIYCNSSQAYSAAKKISLPENINSRR